MKIIRCALCFSERTLDDEEEALSNKLIIENFKLCNRHEERLREATMQSEFPKSNSNFLKTSMFQDTEVPMTFLGWDKKANEDREVKGQKKSWKENLIYCLRYSYPEMAKDQAGELRLDKNGNPFKNSNYDPNYSHGYTIVYHFQEGDLETGSLPLFNAFCGVRPSAGEIVLIYKTGIDKETKWCVRKAQSNLQVHPKDDLPEIRLDETGSEESVPF